MTYVLGVFGINKQAGPVLDGLNNGLDNIGGKWGAAKTTAKATSTADKIFSGIISSMDYDFPFQGIVVVTPLNTF